MEEKKITRATGFTPPWYFKSVTDVLYSDNFGRVENVLDQNEGVVIWMLNLCFFLGVFYVTFVKKNH